MSKKTDTVEAPNNDTVNHDGKTEAELNETIEVLKIQLKEHIEKVNYHQTMGLKVQGALEVVEQFVASKDNKENGVAAD